MTAQIVGLDGRKVRRPKAKAAKGKPKLKAAEQRKLEQVLIDQKLANAAALYRDFVARLEHPAVVARLKYDDACNIERNAYMAFWAIYESRDRT